MISRREALKGALAAAAAVAGRLQDPAAAQTTRRAPPSAADLVLTNGKFVDGRGMVASAVTIRNGRIAALNATTRVAPDARRIDLGGRTVIPGFVDAHVHYTRAGVNPGYEARRIERAFSIAELQEAISKRAASVPPGAFITCVGGWNHTQFKESRKPSRAELDDAAPRHAVYISGTGGGTGAITNSLGRAFLMMRGVAVDEASGTVTSPADAVAALQAAQTADDRLRGTAESNAHANGLGLYDGRQRGQFRRSGIAAAPVA